MFYRRLALIGLLTAVGFTSVAHATDYKFAVGCPYRSFTVLWSTGSVDPGQEWLRVATGTKHPGCGVANFNARSHGSLKVEARYSHEGGVIEGIPLVGAIVCGLFGC